MNYLQYFQILSILFLVIHCQKSQDSSVEYTVETRSIPENLEFEDNQEFGWNLFDIVHQSKIRYKAVSYDGLNKDVLKQKDEEVQQYLQTMYQSGMVANSIIQLQCKRDNPVFPLNNQQLCYNKGSNSNNGWIIELKWQDNFDSDWQFQIGVDFHYGMAIFLDNQFYKSFYGNRWWSNNWNSPDVVNINFNLKKGQHKLIIIGAEKCCDGKMDIRFTRNGGNWQPFNQESLLNSIQQVNSKVKRAELTIMTKQYQFEKLQSQGEQFGFDLVEIFQKSEQPQGYCTNVQPVLPYFNKLTCRGTGKDIIWLISYDFYLMEETLIEFKFKVDFGGGIAIFIDAEFDQSKNQNLEWQEQFNSNTITKTENIFEPGYHNIQVFGIEDCCDQGFNIQFRVNNTKWQKLTPNNWDQYIKYPKNNVYVDNKSYKNQIVNGVSDSEIAWNMRLAYDEAEFLKGNCQINNPVWPLKNSDICKSGKNKNLIWKIEISFYQFEQAKYQFEFGVDFGKGYALFFDGQIISASNKDIWWQNNWESQNIIKEIFTAEQGQHDLILFGVEQCCGGNQDIRFKRNDGDWTNINNFYDNLGLEHKEYEIKKENVKIFNIYTNESRIEKIKKNKL